MLKRFEVIIIVLLALAMFSPRLGAQSASPEQSGDWWKNHDKWNTALPDKSVYKEVKPAPAPRRDLSGTWDGLAEGGTQAKGPNQFPDDARHMPDPPFTAAGKEARLRNKAGEGEGQVPAGEDNDPVDSCDPLGFPRSDLFL